MLARHRNDAIVATKVWTTSARSRNASSLATDLVIGVILMRPFAAGDLVTARADGRQRRSGRRTVVRRGGKELVERFAR
jgi:hypothetical protein